MAKRIRLTLYLLLGVSTALAQDEGWRVRIEAAELAYREADYSTAQREIEAAVQQASGDTAAAVEVVESLTRIERILRQQGQRRQAGFLLRQAFTLSTGRTDAYFGDNGITRPIVRRRAGNPSYTPEARDAEIEGIVGLNTVIETDGTVTVWRVSEELGYGLEEKAVEFLQDWRFSPGTKDGEIVPVIVNIEVNFALP